MIEQSPVHIPPFSTPEHPAPTRVRFGPLTILLFVLCDFLAIVCGLGWWYGQPTGRSLPIEVTIVPGSTVSDIAQTLFEYEVIQSPTLFQLVVRYENKDTVLPSGAFVFPPDEHLWDVVSRLARLDRGIDRVRLTIPEGLTSREMARLVSGALHKVDEEEFLGLLERPKHYVFPDTYFWYGNATSGDVVSTMEDEWSIRTKELKSAVEASGKNWDDIVVMASIIEEEAVTDSDRKRVSGVLWNRINIDMRLQVDASFAYLMDKASSEITMQDLEYNSPYNTYKHKGLPPGPISHPGLSSLTAAVFPTPSKDLYYLADASGVTHFARTFEEHKKNKDRYLR
jgi:UPF0755 protein